MEALIRSQHPYLILELTDEFLRELGGSAQKVVAFLKCHGYLLYRIEWNGMSELSEPPTEQANICCVPRGCSVPLFQSLIQRGTIGVGMAHSRQLARVSAHLRDREYTGWFATLIRKSAISRWHDNLCVSSRFPQMGMRERTYLLPTYYLPPMKRHWRGVLRVPRVACCDVTNSRPVGSDRRPQL